MGPESCSLIGQPCSPQQQLIEEEDEEEETPLLRQIVASPADHSTISNYFVDAAG
jgi:hypothetical protein